VIDVARFTGDQVKFGARVTIVDEESEDEKTYRIVGQYEADMKNGSISVTSPLAKALMGKKVGDSVEVPAPAAPGRSRSPPSTTPDRTAIAARPGRPGVPGAPFVFPATETEDHRCPP
jgi:hypothetical protein